MLLLSFFHQRKLFNLMIRKKKLLFGSNILIKSKKNNIKYNIIKKKKKTRIKIKIKKKTRIKIKTKTRIKKKKKTKTKTRIKIKTKKNKRRT